MGFALKLEDLPHYTISEWEKWEGNWEIINGVPYAMSPAPEPRHQRINYKLLRELDDALANCTKCEALMPVNIKFSDNTVVIPDVVVLCGQQQEKLYIEETPLIIAEILSPSTTQKDLNVKFNLYCENGVKYYLIVNPKNNTVKIFELIDGKYDSVFESGEEDFTFSLPECSPTVNFSKIW